jgi:hypothetical protein
MPVRSIIWWETIAASAGAALTVHDVQADNPADFNAAVLTFLASLKRF